MAYSVGAVSAAELADQAANNPCFLGFNVLELSSVTPEWSTSGAWSTSTDSVNADYPTSNLFNRVFDDDSRPTGTASTWYLLFQLDDTDPRNVIDTALLQHSIGDCISAGTVTVVITIANDADFTDDVVDIVPSPDWQLDAGAVGNRRRRAISFDGGSARYTGVRYVRVSFTGSGTGNWIPQISELWLGRRRQLHRGPNEPHDPGPVESRVSDQSDEAGGVTRYVFGEQQIQFSGSWDLTPDETDLATFSALKTDTRGLTRPFAYWLGDDDIWVFVWLLASPAYRRPFRSAAHREFSLAAVEQTPFLYPEIEAV